MLNPFSERIHTVVSELFTFNETQYKTIKIYDLNDSGCEEPAMSQQRSPSYRWNENWSLPLLLVSLDDATNENRW